MTGLSIGIKWIKTSFDKSLYCIIYIYIIPKSMNSIWTLDSSRKKKLPFQYKWRDIYREPSLWEEFWYFLKEITPTNSYPIVLVWDWKEDEYNNKELIDTIAFQHVNNPNSVVFITKEQEWIFDIRVFGKKNDSDIPHTHIGPIHSSHLLSWQEFPKSWKIHLEFQKHIYQVRGFVADNIIK